MNDTITSEEKAVRRIPIGTMFKIENPKEVGVTSLIENSWLICRVTSNDSYNPHWSGPQRGKFEIVDWTTFELEWIEAWFANGTLRIIR